MSRNATASWSGYAHQGKIGLLVAIRKLISLHGSDPDLSTYQIKYETQEDVSLTENGIPIQIHQVKAYTSGSTIGSYTEALAAFETCAGGNYLHSICDITNWANLIVAQNPGAVIRFPYSPAANYCSLDDIDGTIDSDIFSLLVSLAHPERNNELWRKEVFYNFLGALDEKIRVEHSTKAQVDYDISFTLAEISEIIIERSQRRAGILGSIKQRVFEAYLEFLFDLENGNVVLSQDKELLISNCIKNIYGLGDKEFEQFLRDINPHTTQGISFEQCVTTDSYFSKENFQAVFIECIREVNNCDFLLPASKPPHFFKGKYYLLTSINSPEAHLKKCARQILLNDKVNFTSYETDFIINESHTGELGNIVSVLNDYNPSKFFARKNMSFVKKQDVIPLLNL